jgi:hypothetical protein
MHINSRENSQHLMYVGMYTPAGILTDDLCLKGVDEDEDRYLGTYLPCHNVYYL